MKRILYVLVVVSLLAGLTGITGCGTRYALAVIVVPTEGGDVTLVPQKAEYDAGTQIKAKAVPASGWRFDHWGDDASGTSDVIDITMDNNKVITAHFTRVSLPVTQAPRVFTLSTSVSPAGAGSVLPISGTYPSGTRVTVTAQPAPGWRFDHWEGNATGTSNTVDVTMESDKEVTACFSQVVVEKSDIIIEDDFVDNRNNWYESDEKYIKDGAYNFVINEPGRTVSTTTFKWPDLAPDCPDFVLEVSVTKVKGQDDMEFGFEFLIRQIKHEGVNGSFRFVITGKGQYALRRYEKTSETEKSRDYKYIIPLTKSSHIKTGNASNILKVTCRSQVIELYANDQLLETVTGQFPSDIGDNGIGLTASGSDIHVAFEAIKMWPLAP